MPILRSPSKVKLVQKRNKKLDGKRRKKELF
jgi:hypothetical protein